MNANDYHTLFKRPALEPDKYWPAEKEHLSQRIVASGLLRINTDNGRNFILYQGTDFDKSFSIRELTDPALLPETKRIIADTLPGMAGARGIADTYQRLLNESRKTGMILPEREAQIARLLIQATEPCVIELCLKFGVKLFVSYSHNIGDLMPVHSWESDGTNSGMQSVSDDATAVYVSCGGDPFVESEDEKTYTSDGFPALARLLVIAGQELGHFADILRDDHGHTTGRHSAYLWPLRAKEAVRQARLNDQQTVARWIQIMNQLGMPLLEQREKTLIFVRKHRPWSAERAWHTLRIAEIKKLMRATAKKQSIALLNVFPTSLPEHPHFAHNVMRCLADMAFNLAPEADVYRRANPIEEEAIACIEALARVPQQVNKWGHDVTRLCWPNLYKVYYEQVIPACEKGLGSRI